MHRIFGILLGIIVVCLLAGMTPAAIGGTIGNAIEATFSFFGNLADGMAGSDNGVG